MNGPQGNWKVTGERTVELGRYVVEFAPGLESFVVTEKGAGKVATGKRKGARAEADLSPMKTAPVAPSVVPQPPLPNPLTPAQQAANRNAQAATRNAQAVAAQIAKLQEPFATIAAEAEKATKDVTAAYLSALDQLQGQKASAGDIDGVVAIKQERDRVTNNAQPTAADLQAMSAPVRKLRATYEADTRKAAEESVRRDKLARSSYLANLEALQKRLNASGEIEQGLLVKAEKERFIEQLAANKGSSPTIPHAASPAIPTKPTSEPNRSTTYVAPVIGRWIWHYDGHQYPHEVRADGVVDRNDSWKRLPDGRYEFIWGGGAFVDKLTLSEDRQRLYGTNQRKQKITAVRVKQ